MKIKVETWLNDEAEEYLINLVAQGYYGEAWVFINKINDSFIKSLYRIALEYTLIKNGGDGCL